MCKLSKSFRKIETDKEKKTTSKEKENEAKAEEVLVAGNERLTQMPTQLKNIFAPTSGIRILDFFTLPSLLLARTGKID